MTAELRVARRIRDNAEAVASLHRRITFAVRFGFRFQVRLLFWCKAFQNRHSRLKLE
jgi:hypothetical protein